MKTVKVPETVAKTLKLKAAPVKKNTNVYPEDFTTVIDDLKSMIAKILPIYYEEITEADDMDHVRQCMFQIQRYKSLDIMLLKKMSVGTLITGIKAILDKHKPLPSWVKKRLLAFLSVPENVKITRDEKTILKRVVNKDLWQDIITKKEQPNVDKLINFGLIKLYPRPLGKDKNGNPRYRYALTPIGETRMK